MIIFGTRRLVKLLAVQVFVCAYCGREAAQRLSQIATWFALFFVPVFPVSTRRVFTCAYCGRGTELDAPTADRFVADATAGAPQPGAQA